MTIQSFAREDLLKRLVHFIEDDREIATYRHVAKKFDLDVRLAKQLLQKYVESRRAEFDEPLCVIYHITGIRTNTLEIENIDLIIHEDLLETLEKGFRVTHKEVYSIQAREVKDVEPLYVADSMPNALAADKLKVFRGLPLIQSDSVVPRAAGQRGIPSSATAPFTAKTLATVETEEKKVFAKTASTFHALKSRSEDNEAPQAPPKATGPASAWVKAGGLDQKSAEPIKKTIQSKKQIPSPKKEPADVESEDEDLVAPKRKSTRRRKILDDSDDETPMASEESTPFNPASDDEDSKDSASSKLGNGTLVLEEDNGPMERSPSPDAPRVIRRKRTKALDDDEEENEQPAKKSCPRKAVTICSNIGSLTGVSDDEDMSDGESAKPKKKATKKRPSPSADPPSRKRQKAYSIKENAYKEKRSQRTTDSEDEEEENRPGCSKSASKRQNAYGSDVEENAEEENDHDKGKLAQTEIKSFLTDSSAVSKPQVKKVLRKVVDDDGFLVDKWVNADEAEGLPVKQEKPEKKTSVNGSRGAEQPEKPKPAPKKVPAKDNGKAKQASLMSFFGKKA